MTRLIALLTKRDDWSYEEFIEYWMNQHAPLVTQIPNLRRYSTMLPYDVEVSAYDGAADLYFDTLEELEAAFESEEWERGREDTAYFTEDVVRCIFDETVQYDEK